jgi:hypothetical protein
MEERIMFASLVVRTRRVRLLAGVLVALAAVSVLGAREGTARPVKAQPAGYPSFVARLTGSDAFIGLGVTADGKEWLAYVCDSVFYGEWFRGTVEADKTQIEIQSGSGAKLRLEFGGMGVGSALEAGKTPVGFLETGTGVSLGFATETAREGSGLFRADRDVDGRNVTGGWIVIDGEGRGALLEHLPGGIDRLWGLGRDAAKDVDFGAKVANVQNFGRFDLAEVDSSFVGSFARR